MLDMISDETLRAEYIRRFTVRRGERMDGSEAAARHFQALLVSEEAQECFLVMFLDGRNKLIRVEDLFRGTLTTSAVYPREIVRMALEANAVALVLAHNHPSGNLNPSQDDIQISRRIKEAAQLMDISLHDHIIVGYGKESWYSFADHGLL